AGSGSSAGSGSMGGGGCGGVPGPGCAGGGGWGGVCSPSPPGGPAFERLANGRPPRLDRIRGSPSCCRLVGKGGGMTRAAGASVLVGSLLAALYVPAGHAQGDISILVLKEHGTGSQALAQPSVDRFVALAAAQNGWPGAKGQYYTSPGPADA